MHCSGDGWNSCSWLGFEFCDTCVSYGANMGWQVTQCLKPNLFPLVVSVED